MKSSVEAVNRAEENEKNCKYICILSGVVILCLTIMIVAIMNDPSNTIFPDDSLKYTFEITRHGARAPQAESEFPVSAG